MWMHPDDARSDFILAAATTGLGLFAVGLVVSLPFYPGGLIRELLAVAWIFVLTGLVPVLLARYREHGGAAFGLDADREHLSYGLLLAVPPAIVGVLRGLPRGLVDALLGRMSPNVDSSPAIADLNTAEVLPLDLLIDLLAGVVLFLGALLLFTFLTLRAADGFRRTELSMTEALRTFGMGAAVAALVMGLLTAIGERISSLSVLLNVAGLIAMVLLTDRVTPARQMTSRATVLGPAITALVVHLLATGGVFGGNLLVGLYSGLLAGGTVVVIAILVEARYAWAAVPMLAALALYPTCLSPLPFEVGALTC